MSTETLIDQRWSGNIFLGKWTSAERQHAVMEPATQGKLGSIGLAESADVGRAADLATPAQTLWASMPATQRAGIVRRAAELFALHTEEIADWVVRESGSTRAKARAEIAACVGHAFEAAALCLQPPGLVLPDSGNGPSGISLAQRVPRGIVGVISPFNFPLVLAFRSVIPALALGNAVILKPDPRTAVCGGVVIARILEEAGLPRALFHLLPGNADVGEEMCRHRSVPMIVFVGSTAVGRKVGALCGTHLKKVTLELGGKNSAIVLDDADLELAVSNVAWGSWFHQGQICMATGRVLVARAIAPAFIDALSAKAASLRMGDPYCEDVHLGPLIDGPQAALVGRIVDASIAAGARRTSARAAEGLFYPPTVLADVGPGMPAFENEIFGPVAAVTIFDGDDDAVRLAVSTEYGLSASVFTASTQRGLRIARQLPVGLAHVNAPTVGGDSAVPFGGFGASGNGSRQGGPANLDEFTQWQWLTFQERPRMMM